MSFEKPVLHYFNGRGRAEIVRLTMVAAGIEWSDVIFKNVDDWQNLKASGKMLFGQCPLLEMDGKNLVQSASTARYIAKKANLLGDNDDDALKIDMLFEGSRDFISVFMSYGFTPYATVIQNAKNSTLKKYMPVFEKVLKDNGTGFLVGNKMTFADLSLLEPLLWVEELLKEELDQYEEIKKFLEMMKNNEKIKNYLNGPQRHRINDDKYVSEVKTILQF